MAAEFERLRERPIGIIGIVIHLSAYLSRISFGSPLDSGPKIIKSFSWYVTSEYLFLHFVVAK